MNPTVLITGAASGIGLACTEWFLCHGWNVLAADVNQRAGDQLLAKFQSEAGRLTFVKTDVAVEADIIAAIDCAVSSFKGLDCVVNNAGIGGAFGPVTELEVDDWDYTFSILMRGVFLGTKHGARMMGSRGQGGSIINIASVGGLRSGGAPQAYSAAKAGVVMFGQSAAAELAPQRIRVNTVCPGVILTPLAGDLDTLARGLRNVQPWPEVGKPRDVANVVGFLASDQATFITGASIPVDGGLLASGMRLENAFGNNVGLNGLVGVNRGSSGERSLVRRRVGQSDE